MVRLARFAAGCGAVALAAAALSCTTLSRRGGVTANPSYGLDASVGFDAEGRARVRLAVAIPYSELVFERNRVGHFESRLLLTAALRDARHRQVAGDAWPCVVQAETYAQTRSAERVFEREVELPVEPGSYEFTAAVQVQGTRRRVERTLPLEVPERADGALWLAEPQFWERGRAGAGDSLVRNAARRYTRDSGDPHVRSEVWDPQPEPGEGRYRVEYLVHDEQGADVLRGELDVAPTPPRTRLDLDLPLQPLHLGSYRLDLEVHRGEQAARASGRFEVGFAALAWAGNLAETLQMLDVVLPPEEVDSLRHAPPEERERRWRSLWARRDPDPATPANEFMDRLFERVRFANAHFSAGQPGWRTDRGRIYLKLGAPDEVRDLHGEAAGDDLQRWTYYEENRVFVFVDREGRGEYRLHRSNANP